MAPSSATSPAVNRAGAQLSNTKTTVEFRAALVAMAIVALIPLGVSNPYWLGVLIVSMYFAILAGGWNLLAGYTGQFSLAPATFAMIGAYTTGLLNHYFGVPPLLGVGFRRWWCRALSVCCSAAPCCGLSVLILRSPP